MSYQVTWWRVSFDGTDWHCEPVYCAETTQDQTVWYVQAPTAEAARAEAVRRRARERILARRAEYAQRGLCRCGRKRDREDRTRCRVCRERQVAEEQRRAARLAASEEASSAPVAARQNPAEAQAVRRATLRQSERLATLLEVRAEFERTRRLGPSRDRDFTLWLADKIAKAK